MYLLLRALAEVTCSLGAVVVLQLMIFLSYLCSDTFVGNHSPEADAFIWEFIGFQIWLHTWENTKSPNVKSAGGCAWLIAAKADPLKVIKVKVRVFNFLLDSQ